MNTVKIDPINREEALRYLAAGGSTPDENLSALMDSCEEKLLAAVRGKFTFRVFDIEKITDDEVILADSELVLSGKDISRHLSSCTKAVLLAATIGGEVDRLIRTEQISDMASAVVIDAMAGCAIEQVCDLAEEAVRKSFPDMNMTWRFSPGYGDMPISCQKKFVDSVNAAREIGLNVSENFIMIPRKSVTAVIGLSEEPIEKKRRGCAVCSMRERCEFHKRGSRCTN
ncbi:MAG: methionine synthase [Oscillospiraceae bacterium]